MPKYNVTVNLTRTTEYTVEIEDISAKDEGAAEEKIQARIEKIRIDDRKDIVKELDFEQTSDDDQFEYEVNEA
jgi:hypothetical protein